MFHLHKISQIATVDPDMSVIDYERQLNGEGFTGGYRPATGYQTPLSECLAKRTPNLFFLKYGGIEDLCVGGQVVTPGGLSFPIKDYPRAATGPDLRKAVIGSGNLLGHFREISLRVFPLPESQAWGLALFEHQEQVLDSLRRMIGFFIRPLLIRMMGDEEGMGLLRSLNLPHEAKIVYAFKLAGLKGMVEAEKETILKMHEGENVFFHWATRPAEVEVLDQTLVTSESFFSMVDPLSPLVGRSPKSPVTRAEEVFSRYCKEHPC